jgi:hypothetical protein
LNLFLKAYYALAAFNAIRSTNINLIPSIYKGKALEEKYILSRSKNSSISLLITTFNPKYPNEDKGLLAPFI